MPCVAFFYDCSVQRVLLNNSDDDDDDDDDNNTSKNFMKVSGLPS